jgi:hypothetical protein
MAERRSTRLVLAIALASSAIVGGRGMAVAQGTERESESDGEGEGESGSESGTGREAAGEGDARAEDAEGEEPSAVAEPFEIPPEEAPRPPFAREPEPLANEAVDDPVTQEILRFWGENRFFVSGVLDLGLLFLRPRFQFGYGTPHELWGGLQIDPILSSSGVGLYGGLRGEIPHLDLRIGGRYRYSFTGNFLMPLDGYDHLQYRDRTLDDASYLSLEAQLSGDIPIGSTAILLETTATYVTLVPEQTYLFEETLKLIVGPGFLWSGVIGYRIRFGDDDAFYITPQVELVHLVERDAFMVRVGLRAGIRLWPDLEVRLIAMPTIVSPDSLGASNGDTFLLGIRYLWATDAPRFGD